MASDPLSPGDHYFTADGVTFHYAVAGNGPLFVCHSVAWGMPVTYMQNGMGPHLEKSRTAVYFEPRGNGRSSHPEDETTMATVRVADDIELLRAHLGLETIPVLLGHSNGGAIVLRYAEKYPDRVEKAIVVDGQIMDAWNSDRFGQWVERRKDDDRYKAAIAGFLGARSDPPKTDEEFAKLMDTILSWYFTDPDTYLDEFKGHIVPKDGGPGPGVWAFQRNGPLDRNPENVIPHVAEGGKVQARTLLVWGEEDAMCDLDLGKAVAEAVPGSRLVAFPECGHFPWVEKREAFWKAVDEFLKE